METYFIQTRHASERIQLALYQVIPPKENTIDPTGKLLAHKSCARFYCGEYFHKLEMGGDIIHTKGDVFHTNTTCI